MVVQIIILMLPMEKEIYKDIAGFPNYLVSNLGNVKNKHSNKLLKPYLTRGYPRVSLYDADGKRCCKLVHRLVAQAFIPNPENLPVVNHISGIKTDARVSNLEWVSYSENLSHAHSNGLRPLINTQGDNNGFSKLTLVTATEIKKLAVLGTLSQEKIATKFNISRSTVRDIKLGRRWKHLA